MKLIMENWRRLLLNEAAKNAKDLKNFYEENWTEHNNMIRGLWKKYGMWKLGEMMNIGIPQHVQDNWGSYPKETKDRISKQYWGLMTKFKPPVSIVIVSERGGEMEVSYGAIFPKTGSPAILLKFESGVNKKAGNLMRKGFPIQGMPGGSIEFNKPKQVYGKSDECNDAFVVNNTHQTTDGWGPLLYDIAMEVATVLGGGLTSSRKMVSSNAKPVWDYYQDKRSDVSKDQMDIEKNQANDFGLKQLTPNDPKDDCGQKASIEWAHGEDYGAWEKYDAKNVWAKTRSMSSDERTDVPWKDQSVSKSYQKDPDILKFLGEAGLLHFPKLGYNAMKFHTSDLPPFPEDDTEEPPPEPDFRDNPVPGEKPFIDKEADRALKDKIIKQALRHRLEERNIRIKIK